VVSTDPFVDPSDVAAALLRPLTDLETQYVPAIIDQASALLRLAAPSIDDRIARFAADPTDLSGVSEAAVGAVVAGIVKKYLTNPSGVASTSQTMGPYNNSVSYALRSEKEVRGVLQVTPADLAALFPNRKRLRAGTIRTRAALAPRPVGRYGMVTSIGQAVEAVLTFSRDGTAELGAPLFLGIEGAL
jgi:hypothetical protein